MKIDIAHGTVSIDTLDSSNVVINMHDMEAFMATLQEGLQDLVAKATDLQATNQAVEDKVDQALVLIHDLEEQVSASGSITVEQLQNVSALLDAAKAPALDALSKLSTP